MAELPDAATIDACDVLREALLPLRSRVCLAFVYGSLARGDARDHSDVDLLIVGNVPLADVVCALRRAGRVLGREINPVDYTPEQFRHLMSSGDYFLRTVVEEPKFWLIGSEDELAQLVG